MSVISHHFLQLLCLLIVCSIVWAGTSGTTRCAKKNKLSPETVNIYKAWKIPKKLSTKEEKCYLHCVLQELGWMKDHQIMDGQIQIDINEVMDVNQQTTHLRTLLFENCNIKERETARKCKKAFGLYRCLLTKYEPKKGFRDAFKRAEKRSER